MDLDIKITLDNSRHDVIIGAKTTTQYALSTVKSDNERERYKKSSS